MTKKLEREFYQTDGVCLAKSLLGKVLVRESPEGLTSGVIIETEAYMGPDDAAAHSYRHKGRDGRTNIQYGPGGFAYVYLIYGMYCCFNVTANAPGAPECVLIRALEPLDGIELMKSRRGVNDVKKLCDGPGKLCKAMSITRENYGADLLGETLYIAESKDSAFTIAASKRINIGYAGEAADYLYRFTMEKDNAH